MKNAAFSQQKFRISFALTQSKSGRILNIEGIYTPDLIQFQQKLLSSWSSPIQVQPNVHLCPGAGQGEFLLALGGSVSSEISEMRYFWLHIM